MANTATAMAAMVMVMATAMVMAMATVLMEKTVQAITAKKTILKERRNAIIVTTAKNKNG